MANHNPKSELSGLSIEMIFSFNYLLSNLPLMVRIGLIYYKDIHLFSGNATFVYDFFSKSFTNKLLKDVLSKLDYYLHFLGNDSLL
jgi:hypothetical protein